MGHKSDGHSEEGCMVCDLINEPRCRLELCARRDPHKTTATGGELTLAKFSELNKQMDQYKKKEALIKKVINKAVENGFEAVDNESHAYPVTTDHYHQAIFSHRFAIAFWEDDMVGPQCGAIPSGCECGCAYENEIYRWQYHLQQIVLEEDPIQYLEQFL